jgi:hypothetical protein
LTRWSHTAPCTSAILAPFDGSGRFDHHPRRSPGRNSNEGRSLPGS